MTLKGHRKFVQKLNHGFQIRPKIIGEFLSSRQERSDFSNFIGLFSLKVSQKLDFVILKGLDKFGQKLNCGFQIRPKKPNCGFQFSPKKWINFCPTGNND